jgi:pimeloyl-ACP methyl ester carboxylesterase
MKKQLVRMACTLFPSKVVKYAYYKLTHPQIFKLRPFELDFIVKAEKESMKFGESDIQLYKWGNGSKKLLAIHGWEGQAANFTKVIEQLIESDFTVYAFDAPSHGLSTKGETSLFEFIELVGLLIQKFNPEYLISHSFGAVATTYSLSLAESINIKKYVLFTAPDKFSERIDYVAEQVGMTDKVKGLLIDRLEKEINMPVAPLNVSEFVKSLETIQALIVHDVDDRVVEIACARVVNDNWPSSTLQEIEGTGHFRILLDHKVIGDVVGFFKYLKCFRYISLK